MDTLISVVFFIALWFAVVVIKHRFLEYLFLFYGIGLLAAVGLAVVGLCTKIIPAAINNHDGYAMLSIFFWVVAVTWFLMSSINEWRSKRLYKMWMLESGIHKPVLELTETELRKYSDWLKAKHL